MKAFFQKFWWIVVALALAGFAYFRHIKQKAAKAKVLEEMALSRIKFDEQYKEIGVKDRQKARDLRVERAKAEAALKEKQDEIDRAISGDDDALIRAWNRAFGASPRLDTGHDGDPDQPGGPRLF